ncbi:hypothetical protein CONCODRAFT_9587 [Conidiobolus coronatus NRRL 28638]|uniref:Uncharacterized protein n=1 Tax=Conidiobolus coronatus (strain ATCC 28846 / CBS 209.66 / NRRL 28638) TaxID=796925 RepID=A0A137NZG8_CONC2|nr:hypothetical protein CONCODRAFT_9587 [Conidiobolus coronatus NRRL 28638]|eukprot:KXN68205.1 hypothetical protein CONCODRAFT_9587 [Conidiobolus coronatus NRRL 28638]
MLSTMLSSFLSLILSIHAINGANWIGPIPQDVYKYSYGEYWGQDQNSCIVSDTTLFSLSSNFIGIPSIQICDGKYQVNWKKLVLPRNTIPMCGYIPALYNTGASNYRLITQLGLILGNATYKNYKNQCLDEMSVSSKSRFNEMYNVDSHDTACMRYAEFLTVTYGLDPEIRKIADSVENMISNNLKWRNTKIQANLIVSGACVATNKVSCISLWKHLFEEKDNSYLNLIGMDIKKTPTTWLYADGIDIELLHPLVEIMGMDLQTKIVDGIHYHHISPNSPEGESVKRIPGLVGGIPKSL